MTIQYLHLGLQRDVTLATASPENGMMMMMMMMMRRNEVLARLVVALILQCSTRPGWASFFGAVFSMDPRGHSCNKGISLSAGANS